jgi:1-pyrroline-5-carboxylate dehydrogenase
MGGKNPAIVAASADLDDAAAGIAASAYGFSGQKCSACSRAIVVASGQALELPGHFVAPAVVAGLPRGHRLEREELFVPLVAVTRVGSFDEALAEANAIDYGLTAGVFSRDDAELDRFLDEIEAGVVYVNRRAGATTGAWPGFQSFCGWKSSGSTGKGGLGPYYVQQFMREQSRTVVRA